MNYTWALPGFLNEEGRPPTGAELDYFNSWELDYSREAFPDLDQRNLDETAGIGGHPGHSLRIQTTGRYVNEKGPVDWDNNGLSNETVFVQLTKPTPVTGVLTGYADWSNLQYYFLESPDFEEGAISSLEEELTVELWQSFVDWRALPGDYNLSGTVDAADLTVWQDTFGQAAISPFAYADGNGNSTIGGGDFLVWQRNFANDINDPGQLQFLQPSYVVSETAGVFNVAVERIGGMQGAITVDFELEDGTALSTLDYVAASGTLSFADGQTSQIISIQINDDELEEGDEYFNVTLSNPTGGASLGNSSTTAFTIDDNEGPIVVRNTNDSGSFSLRQAIQIANLRPGADTILFDAALFATPQTITLGSELQITDTLTIDATALPQNVTIDANNGSRIFNIDDPLSTTENFNVTLAGLNFTGGRTIGNNVDFSDTTYSGGAIRSLTTGNLTLDQSTVSGNTTTGANASGGGIFIFAADGSGAVTLTDSTVSGNTSAAAGGGIFMFSGAVTLTGSTVSGNTSASTGGGIYTHTSMVLIANSTVTGNTAGGVGGGLATYSDAENPYFEKQITIRNSIVAGNTDNGTAPDINAPEDPNDLTVNFNLIGDTTGSGITAGSGNILNQPALLGPLADNGGPTLTHALLADSLAIDAGDPSIVFNPTEFDQRGAPFVRVFDDPVALGSGIDMGAYEVQIAAAVSADFDGFIAGFDFLLWQRGFGTTTGVTKTDGYADSDGDVDVDDVDLGFWESQFGQPAPIAAAAVNLSASISSNEPAALAVESVAPMLGANLIDAAMALGWMDASASSGNNSLIFEEYDELLIVPQKSAERGNLLSKTSRSSTDANTSNSTDDDEDVEEGWLSEELLERVFG